MKNARVILIGLALSGISSAVSADSVNIPQIPSGATFVDGKGGEAAMIRPDDNAPASDYQTEILNNPQTNEQARASALLNENKSNGDKHEETTTGDGE